MRLLMLVLLIVTCMNPCQAQIFFKSSPSSGYEKRIKDCIDTMKVFDTHEHFISPTVLKNADFFDFMFLLQQNSYDDLNSAGMPLSYFERLYGNKLTPSAKWELIRPYWEKSFNTASNRILLNTIKDLYGMNNLNSSSASVITLEMRKKYGVEWFNHIIKDLCNIDYIIQSGDSVGKEFDYIKYAKGFGSWLTVRSKFCIDSLAVMQIDPIYSLEDFVKSMRGEFEEALKNKMVVIKINFAYKRTLLIENVTTEEARKVFRNLVNGNEGYKISYREAKPLQDYMVHQLMKLALEKNIPVAFHTGLQAGSGNYINNSDPTLLTSLFRAYKGVNFVLFHGSYPYGGELSTLAKTFKNVYIDMNWTYAISPSYATRYLSEWLETVPASKIMAFGGDQRVAEITYGNLIVARQIIGDVLIEKVSNGLLSEPEAILVARMILHDNALKFYNLQ